MDGGWVSYYERKGGKGPKRVKKDGKGFQVRNENSNTRCRFK